MDTQDLIMQSGRLLNFTNIDDLCQAYKRKIYDMISKMRYKVVVFDFDGTLTEFKYANKTLLPCKESDLYEYSKTNNIYENVNFLRTMQYIISELDLDLVYILTSTRETLIDKKNEAIYKAYSDIKKDHIIHVNGGSAKIEKLKELHDKHNKDIIFVEDTASNIQLVDEEGTMNYVYGIHISSFLV